MAVGDHLAAALAFSREASWQPRDNADMYARLLEMDDQLVLEGFPPMSSWWKERFRRFYRDRVPRGCYRAVDRVGRRGGKSTTLTRVAAAEGLYGAWKIPPGDVGQFHIFSVKVGYAEDRLVNLVAILDALGMREDRDYHAGRDRKGAFVRLAHRPIEWRATPANFRTAVSFTAIGALYDELARWRDEKTGKNPATHVLESVRPALLTQFKHGAKEFMISSPWANLDAHYDHFELGRTKAQDVAHAASWQANPTVSKAECQLLASEAGLAGQWEDSDFEREYRAIPMAGGSGALFDPQAISTAVAAGSTVLPEVHHPIGSMLTAGADFGFRRNSSALVVSRRIGEVYRVVELLELAPGRAGPLIPSEVVSQFADRLAAHGVDALMADGHYRESIVEQLIRYRLGFLDAPRDVPSTYIRFRTLLHGGFIELPSHRQLVRDLAEVSSRPTASGGISIVLPHRPGGAHADVVSALVLSCYQAHGIEVLARPDTAVMSSYEQKMYERTRAALGLDEQTDGFYDAPEGGFYH